MLIKGIWVRSVRCVISYKECRDAFVEDHDGVSEGKYSVGLGQERMAVCSVVEDAISMSLNAFSRLLSRFQVPCDRIGRIDVGSESNPDRAKSIKSHLLSLLGGSTFIAGSDNIQACYGGTAALLNCAAWLESSQWEPGKLAVVVAGDVAIYDSTSTSTSNSTSSANSNTSARATGGAGAVAILLGRGCASIKLERFFGHYATHVFDFYKPDPATESPKVDGPLSISAYLSSAINSYANWSKKASPTPISIRDDDDHFSSLIFHSPYAKIVYKAFCQLYLLNIDSNSTKTNNNTSNSNSNSTSSKVLKIKDISSVSPEEMEKIDSLFKEKALCNLTFSKQIGNAYCSSIFFNLICALSRHEAGRIGAFSYGSGSMATFFSFYFDGGDQLHWLPDLIADLKSKLAARTKISPKEYESLLQKRKDLYGISNWTATPEDLNHLTEGTFYLHQIDSEFRRYYKRRLNYNGADIDK